METALSALLLSSDPQALGIAKQACDRHGIQTTICRTSAIAAQLLKQKRFDLFVLDFDLRGLNELLSPGSVNCIGYATDVIALAADPERLPESLRKRARHLLKKPLTLDSLIETLKTAYRLIFMEKRRSFRHAVRIPVSAAYTENSRTQALNNAMLHDISQTGLCLQTEAVVPKDALTSIEFQLPGTQDQVRVMGKVIWSDPKGRAGIQFQSASSEGFSKLREWLNAHCPWHPELVVKTPLSSLDRGPAPMLAKSS